MVLKHWAVQLECLWLKVLARVLQLHDVKKVLLTVMMRILTSHSEWCNSLLLLAIVILGSIYSCYRPFSRGGPDENFVVINFYLKDSCVPFFTPVTFPCFEIESVTVIGAFYTYTVQCPPYQRSGFFVRAEVINGEQLPIQVKNGDEFATNFDPFSFPRGDFPKGGHFNKLCHPFTSIGKED